MTPVNIAITVLISLIVVLALLFWWLFKHFASMNEEEQEIYENELNQELDDTLAENALDEIELRDKLKEIMK